MSKHLFTTEPEAVPVGYVRMNRAMVCLEEDCECIFTSGPTCPRCASDRMMPLAAWLDRERT